MKHFTAILAVLAFFATRGEAGDFIRQIQTVLGIQVIYDIPITGDAGTVNSQPLVSDLATFQLYTTYTGADNVSKLLKLDEKTMGTYLPSVTAQILSADPHVPARTRADQPYGIRVIVNGMQTSSTAPDYAKSVRMIRSYGLYDTATYAPTGSGGEYTDLLSILQNGTFVDNAILQRLPYALPTKAVGEEIFTVYTQGLAGILLGQLSKVSVKIWPVATAEISGIDPNQTYTSVPLGGTAMVKDIYPGAKIYAQVYKGPQVLGMAGSVLPSTIVAYSDTTEVPQNQALVLTDLVNTVSQDGDYTIEILTITPFNGGAPERLATLTFKLKRSLSVNGSVTNMEQ